MWYIFRVPHGDDGKPLEVKEGVVLDQAGRVVSTPEPASDWNSGWNQGPFRTHARVKYFRLSPFTAFLFLLSIPLVFTAGLTIAAIVAGIAIIFWIVNRIVRAIF